MPFGEIPLAIITNHYDKDTPHRYTRVGFFTDSAIAVTHSFSVVVTPLENFNHSDPYIAGILLVPIDYGGGNNYFDLSVSTIFLQCHLGAQSFLDEQHIWNTYSRQLGQSVLGTKFSSCLLWLSMVFK
jgi:hypothetical protein